MTAIIKISKGIDSLISIKLKKSSITIHPKSLIGLSGTIKSSLLKPNLFSPIFTKIYSENADVLLGGDVIVHELSDAKIRESDKDASKDDFGNTLYLTKKASLLAYTSTISPSFLKKSLSGSGSVIFSGYANIHKLKIRENEEYYIDYEYLVAYQSLYHPTRFTSISSEDNVDIKNESFLGLVQWYFYRQVQKVSRNGYYGFKRLFLNLIGLKGFEIEKELYKLGPGVYYIQSQQKPSFDNFVLAYNGLKSEGERVRVLAKIFGKKVGEVGVYEAYNEELSEDVKEKESKSDGVSAVAVVGKKGVVFETVRNKNEKDTKKNKAETVNEVNSMKQVNNESKVLKRSWREFIFGNKNN